MTSDRQPIDLHNATVEQALWQEMAIDDRLKRSFVYHPEDPAIAPSAPSTDEQTRLVQPPTSSDESESADAGVDSDDVPIVSKLRAGKFPKGNRQGDGVNAKSRAGVLSPSMPKLTSTTSRQPSYRTYGDHDCVVISCDEITGMQYLHNAISDVTEKPTKKRHQGTAVKDNQPYESKAYEKAVAPYRRDLSKLPAFVPMDAHGFGGPRTKPRDADPGDM